MEAKKYLKRTHEITYTDNHSAKKSCSFWLAKKNRYCLTIPTDDSNFCPSHINKSNPNAGLDSRVRELENVGSPLNVNPTNAEDRNNLNDAPKTDINGDNNNKKDVKTCQFWLERKKRFCKAFPKNDLSYCVEHAINMNIQFDRKRIPCPYDSKHSCYEDQLKSHMKKCNCRPSLRPPFYEQGINSGESDIICDVKLTIKDMDINELNLMITKVTELFNDNKHLIKYDEKHHPSFDESLNDPGNGNNALKHLKQLSSLVGHMRDHHMLDAHTTYIEFGAGRGGLSHWVQLSNTNEDCKYILVDKSSVRYKKDSYHKGPDQGPTFERLKINIEDLDLNKVTTLQGSAHTIIGIGKHLCGQATDFMLRCLVNSIGSMKLHGIVLALCCHHRCDWNAYIGKQWFNDHQLDHNHFQMLVKMSAWATCGTRHVLDGKYDEDDVKKSTQETYNHPRYGDLLPEMREKIGFMCKNIIDIGRIEYLKSQKNIEVVDLVQYVSSDVTLENHAIICSFNVSGNLESTN